MRDFEKRKGKRQFSVIMDITTWIRNLMFCYSSTKVSDLG